ncbi:TetR/AcrR family transcriptional regulator [Nonomuraea recticatena]|uniref:TetR/AcrR family transcriptional regulator n=1 Tax=Nonomuraea recticatena TaxID=46178 RepID=UPI003617A0E6
MRQATLAELAEHGYQGLTVENVAARSGVHKTTVYRRWTGVEGLIADALELAAEEPWPVPDTGTIEGTCGSWPGWCAGGWTRPRRPSSPQACRTRPRPGR